MPQLMNQEGLVALVTGASGSVGSMICEMLTMDPSVSLVHGVCRSSLTAPQESSKFRLHEMDLSTHKWDSLPSDVDILVNCAGQPSGKQEAQEVQLDDLIALMDVNAFASARLVARFIPGMRQRRYGRIVNIGSIWSLRGSEKNLAYTMSKHALTGLTKTIAIENIDYGITCNEVCPGPIDSRMMSSVIARIAQEGGRDPQTQRILFEKTLRGKRMVTSREVSAAVLFLTRPEASGISGVSLPVDLGFIA